MKKLFKNKIIRNIVTVSLYTVIALFLLIYIRKLKIDSLRSIQVKWKYFLLAVPFSLFSRALFPFAWVRLMEDMGAHIRAYKDLNYIYAKTWLGRYIPGKVVWVAGKVFFALQQGISKKVLGISSLLEAGMQIFTAIVVGVILLLLSGKGIIVEKGVVYLLSSFIIVSTIFVLPPIFNRIFSWIYRLIKKTSLSPKYYLKLRSLLRLFCLYAIIHSVSGIPIYFIIRALDYNLDFLEIIYVTGSFALAGAIGTLAIVAPSGLGVREGVLIALLGTVLPNELLIVLVVVLRIWAIVLDILYFLISYVAAMVRTKVVKSSFK